MPLNFEKSAQKGNRFLNELAAELGKKSGRENAARILRAVFRVLRDNLTLEENFQLLAQLPMALKAAYVDGWSPMKEGASKTKGKNNFLWEVVKEDGHSAWRDFAGEEEISDAIKAVFRTLRKYVSDGEFHDMIAVLPKAQKKILIKSLKDKINNTTYS